MDVIYVYIYNVDTLFKVLKDNLTPTIVPQYTVFILYNTGNRTSVLINQKSWKEF